MNTTATVRGDRASTTLGATLMHEHVIAVSAALANDRPELAYPLGKDATLDKLVTDLQKVKESGIDTIVDLTVFGHDRDVPALIAINEHVDLNIIVATGFYTDSEPSKTFQVRQRMARYAGNPNAYADIFIRDITLGIGATGVKAGILKCVTDAAGFTEDITDLIVACAIASNETGVPITTHSHPQVKNGTAQVDLLKRHGVDMTRVVIGHSGDTDDLDYLKQIMDTGATIGSDRFDMFYPGTPDQNQKIQVVADLCAQGYADRIVLSHDKMMHTDWFGENTPQASTIPLSVSTEVLPALRELGVSDSDIEQIMVHTPARLLGRAA